MKITRESILLTIFLLVIAQTSLKAEVVSCHSLALMPELADGGNILDRYYISQDGVGGQGCWVHKHSNGKDFVVTPHSWGRNPSSGKTSLINATLAGITDSRRTYSGLGTFDSAIHYLLNDVHKVAQAYWITSNNECWIQAGPKGGLGSWRNESRQYYKGQVAHEIGHCFIMEYLKSDGYSPQTSSEGSTKWWDESGADFLSSLVYPTLNHEHIAAANFDLDGSSFAQKYSASVLLTSYADSSSNKKSLELLRHVFVSTKGVSENAYAVSLLESLRAIGFSEPYHDFVIDHFQGKVNDFGGGHVPRRDGVSSIMTETLQEGEHQIEPPALVAARLNMVELEIPCGMKAVIDAPSEEGLNQALIEEDELKQRNWSGETTITNDTDYPKYVSILFDHINSSTVTTTIKYELTQIDERKKFKCCEYQLDQCLIGKWQSRQSDYKTMIEAIIEQFKTKGLAGHITDYQLDIKYVDLNMHITKKADFSSKDQVMGKGVFKTKEGGKTIAITIGLNYNEAAKGKLCSNKETGILEIGITESNHHDLGSYMKIEHPDIKKQMALIPPEMRSMFESTLNRPLDSQPMFIEGTQKVNYECLEDKLSFPIEAQDGVILKMQFHRKTLN